MKLPTKKKKKKKKKMLFLFRRVNVSTSQAKCTKNAFVIIF